jgi:dolichol-phosphate mannosyltransferase
MESEPSGRSESDQPQALAIVVPLYNEAAGLADFHSGLSRVIATLPYKTQILYVDDGSTDRTPDVLAELRARDSSVVYLTLSRNFGHQAALTAGLESVDGDLVVMMDGDGQHPPELIPEMIRLYGQGFDIVQTQRADVSKDTFKGWTSRAFYSLLSGIGDVRLAPGAADFRLISRDVAQVLRQMREYHRFLRGMTSWLGFRTATLPYQAGTRLAGETKYSLGKMVRLATDGVFSFSLVPLRLGIAAGCFFLVLALAEMLYVSVLWLVPGPHRLVPGWSSVILMVTIGDGVTMALLGFIGIYVGMIFQEVKHRPVYVIRPQRLSYRRERLDERT